MNKKSSYFNIMGLLVMAVILGFGSLVFTPKTPVSGMEAQIHRYLEKESFFLEGHSRREFIEYLIATAKDYEFDPLLILAIIKVESSFNPDAVSNRGAVGLLQLKHVAAREVAKVFETKLVAAHQLFDPYINLKVGVQYLSFLRNHVGGNIPRVLSAYNMGPTRVKQSGIVSSGYASKVLKVYRQLLKSFS